MLAELIDEDYGRRLGDRLHAAVADIEPQPHLAATVRRRYIRRTMLVRATTGAVAVAALAAAGGTVQAIRHTGSDQMRDVGYVRTQALKALDNARSYVVHATTVSDGRIETWVDRASGNQRADRWDAHHTRVFSMSSRSEKDHVSAIIVAYKGRTWKEIRGTARTPLRFRDWTDAFDPESIRAGLSDDRLRLLGKDRVDGQTVLHLRKEVSLAGMTLIYEYWVDAKSFLVRRVSTRTAGEPGAMVTRFEWLPRTAKNLARLKLTPPPGFKKITQ